VKLTLKVPVLCNYYKNKCPVLEIISWALIEWLDVCRGSVYVTGTVRGSWWTRTSRHWTFFLRARSDISRAVTGDYFAMWRHVVGYKCSDVSEEPHIHFQHKVKCASTLEDGTESCAETSVANYQFTMRNIPEQPSFRQRIRPKRWQISGRLHGVTILGAVLFFVL